ncbi:D-glycerate dehydrogenase [Lentibacillus halophilus]|uniref:D-glycerate dehydrogenase n=1 Tax=Lentibacillus halophilus TaxID=295065 RepID=A0ABP3JAB4_9BACI
MTKIIAFNRVMKPVLDELKKTYDVRFFRDIDPETDDEFLKQWEQAEGIIGLDIPANDDMLSRAPHLKIVSNVSVGYNNFDLQALKKRNIMATNTPDVLNDTVADTIFGILVATARRIPELDHFVKNGQWGTESSDNDLFGKDVHHKTLGIIGMGRIGQTIAKRAHFGFDMDILYNSRSRKPDVETTYQAGYRSLDNLLMESDFVLLITPLTSETEGLIGKREFQLMKNNAIFINGSRGNTIVESDLVDALQSGEIAAAGLDVFANEPVEPDNPLLALKNTVTTPHIGSSTYETERKMSELAAKNLKAGLSGRKPPNLVDESVWPE